MVIRVVLLLVVTPTILTAPASLCPAMCKCTTTGINVEARCSSLNFAKKSLSREQLKLLTTLDVSNASLTKMNINLHIFPNLKRLNLSSNSIKQISPSLLPDSLQIIDLSHNFMKHPPHNLYSIINLKEVYLKGNPLHCDCDSVSVIMDLLKYDVTVHLPQCAFPKQYKGKEWNSVECNENLFGGMQGDAPYDGSGFGENEEIGTEEIEHEFIRPGLEHEVTTQTAETDEEGSGDVSEDVPTTSDDYHNVLEPVIVPVDKSDLHSAYVRPCNFDCSTPAPLDNANDTGEFPAPSLYDGMRMVANDLGLIDDHNNETLSSTSASEITSEVSTKITVDAEIMDSGLKNNDELSNISDSSEKQSNTSYIFLGLFLVAIVCLIGYVIFKKRSAARRNAESEQEEENKNDQLEEVELLTKPNTDTGKTNGTPESVPLINGNKENKTNDEDEVLKNLIKEPEPNNEQEVELRKPADNNLLTPEAKRVTIKAGEIPNSTPKTPVLVTRHLSSDGSIVTTPNIDQRV